MVRFLPDEDGVLIMGTYKSPEVVSE
ncbi:hypothetical protein C5167_022818 [Papaver somniferum]|uniref:Uncharacterized protein n=1 Tax=Papaver somniferum TaxID=3469 RepID=A0A4Y7JM10_PAPSO|nr:hypothetical protein C5167_022818 [Papaver somniferum]